MVTTIYLDSINGIENPRVINDWTEVFSTTNHTMVHQKSCLFS